MTTRKRNSKTHPSTPLPGVEEIPLKKFETGSLGEKGFVIDSRQVESIIKTTERRTKFTGVLVVVLDKRVYAITWNGDNTPFIFNGKYIPVPQANPLPDVFLIHRGVFETQKKNGGRVYDSDKLVFRIFLSGGEVMMTGYGPQGEPYVLYGFPKVCAEGEKFNLQKGACETSRIRDNRSRPRTFTPLNSRSRGAGEHSQK